MIKLPRIKKLDWFILKSFLMLFAGTFFICLFIFMMQFLWRYVDELVGKGLGLEVLAKFFYYSSLNLVPPSLPLAILLASLITFGNFGERYELLAMKSAGISLVRIMRPLIILCTFLGVVSFYFQNFVSPRAQRQLWTLLISMKQKSPELDIPEGVFYNEISGYNIYVKNKDRDSGWLRDMLIYDFSDGFNNAHVIWAEKGRLEMTGDKEHLFLHLYNGEQFENLKSQTISSENVPYRRESFREKHILIEFDSNFNMIDGSFLDDRSDAKNIAEITHSIDSLTHRADSIGRDLFVDAEKVYAPSNVSYADSVKIVSEGGYINVDSLFDSYTFLEKERVLSSASSRMGYLASEWGMKSIATSDLDYSIRRHETDRHKKLTLSLGCLIFFFIGAPLGAIIRKGGLGLPVVISVIIFVVYYTIDTGATRVARSGEMDMVLGVWLSSIVLAPLGAFFTYKSNNDSVVFNLELYTNFIRRLFGLRLKRHLTYKEVIIHDPDLDGSEAALERVTAACRNYDSGRKLWKAPNYFRIFTRREPDHRMEDICRTLEGVIDDLSNVRDPRMLKFLNSYPVISASAHTSPFDNMWLNVLTGLIFPLGMVFYIRIWLFRVRLHHDLKKVVALNADVIRCINDEKFIK